MYARFSDVGSGIYYGCYRSIKKGVYFMAMVKITNGAKITTVSRNTYENKFKRYGWREVKEGRKETIDFENEDEKEIDIETIPVSDMNGEQLKQYAKNHGIDISKTKSAAEARKVIQTAIRNKNM